MFKYFLFLIGLLMISSPSFGTCTGLGCNCTVTATGLSFSALNPLLGGTSDATGTVTVTCVALISLSTISYQINLSAGNAGNFSPRKMKQGSNNLNYNLYTDAAHTLVWGDGTGGTSTVADGYSGNLLVARVENYTVYGRISTGSTVVPGSYTDNITATIIF